MSIRIVLKRIATVLIFFAILFLLYIPIDKLLGLNTEDGIMQARTMYDQPKDTVDVVFMGSSHTHCGVNTADLWINYGIAGYDYSAAEQPLWISYYYLKEICKYQTPRLVVLDMCASVAYLDDYQYSWLYDNLAGVRFSLNKLNMILDSCEKDRIFEFFPNIVISHNRYNELEDEDYDYFKSSGKDRNHFKGYTPHFKAEEQVRPTVVQDEIVPITEKSEKYLRKIIQFAEDAGIQLYLVAAPYAQLDEEREGRFNYIQKIADSEGVVFCNYNHLYDEMGIDFAKDFKDDCHLNYDGGVKYSDYLGRTIKSTFSVEDRRGLEEYASWYMNLEDIWGMADEYNQ